MSDIQVIKRNGDKETLDIEKLHQVVFYACENISGVSASEVEIKSHIQFYNGIQSSDIQETLIKSAADLITEETPNYQWVAGRLINYHLRKMVYGDFEPWHILELVNKNVERGFYDPALLEDYTADEWEALNNYIKHARDEDISFVGMEQFRGKYLVQNRATGQIFETPQMAYMLIAATLFSDYPKEERMKWITMMQLVLLISVYLLLLWQVYGRLIDSFRPAFLLSLTTALIVLMLHQVQSSSM